MGTPPIMLDGAMVLEYASFEQPVGFMPYLESSKAPLKVYGFAVCQYVGHPNPIYYLFTCDKDREVIGDSDCQSLEEAKDLLNHMSQYDTKNVYWHKID